LFEIYVDADACPVKQEVIKVARRHQLQVIFASNSWMTIPNSEGIRLEVIESKQLDAVDDWIVERVQKNDIVITADIPLAFRCVKLGAQVLGLTGRIFTEANIGQVLAMRDLMSGLRESGEVSGGGPAPFQPQDRSKFLHSLDQMIQILKRSQT
jgi:uncharacterized protein YaiI (UPF0178 family)